MAASILGAQRPSLLLIQRKTRESAAASGAPGKSPRARATHRDAAAEAQGRTNAQHDREFAESFTIAAKTPKNSDARQAESHYPRGRDTALSDRNTSSYGQL
ncbi:MAG: hypothetical protein OXI38_13095 [Bacteroidota bacterium]|nr:hypothetical protein [Bacteroidota bacterium]